MHACMHVCHLRAMSQWQPITLEKCHSDNNLWDRRPEIWCHATARRVLCVTKIRMNIWCLKNLNSKAAELEISKRTGILNQMTQHVANIRRSTELIISQLTVICTTFHPCNDQWPSIPVVKCSMSNRKSCSNMQHDAIQWQNGATKVTLTLKIESIEMREQLWFQIVWWNKITEPSEAGTNQREELWHWRARGEDTEQLCYMKLWSKEQLCFRVLVPQSLLKKQKAPLLDP